jgi:hypothetical protein
MRILLALLLTNALFADLKSNARAIDTLDYYLVVDPNMAGDTWHFTSWTPTGGGGNFNGGHVYGSLNDGQCDNIGTSSNIALMELTVLDWSTKSNTHISCINRMTGYGGSAATNTPAGWADGNTWKSYNPFAVGGNLFWTVYRQSGSNVGFQSTFIMSPDLGVHWCNTITYASLVAAGHLGVPGCDSSNWSATGDAPADNTKMAFGTYNVATNPMARPMHVQFCQAETCTGSPYDADNYIYFVTMDGLANLYSSCVAKSAGSIMDPTQTYYHTTGNATCGNAASWTHTIGSATAIQSNSIDHYDYPSSVMYIGGQFLMTSYDGDGSGNALTMLLTSQYPWGPYKRFVLGTELTGAFMTGNLALANSSCSGCNTNPGKWELTMMASNYAHAASASVNFYKYPLIAGGPSAPNADPHGKNILGRVPVRISKDGVNKTLIGKGLRFLTTFDDFADYPTTAYAPYASMYARDLLGSTMCVVGGQNAAGGAVQFGAQNATASLSYGTAGLHLGDQYMSQLHSNAGNCSFTLPSTMAGNSSFTVITVLAMDSVSKQQGMIWELQPIGSGAAHNGVSFGTNINVEGGSHVDVYDNNLTLRTNPGLTAGQYNMITFVKVAGAMQTTSTVYFGDGASTKKWCMSGCGSTFVPSGTDSSTLNLSSSAILTLNCATFASATQCKNGGTNSASQGLLGATFTFFAIYDRALSATEVAQNYRVIKAALAQAPRSITVQ